MEVQSNFNFDDFDFDFLDPPSSKQEATNCSTSIQKTCSRQPQKQICKVSNSIQNKRSRLAERICNTDLVVRQQADLQQSANEIKKLYESEKQQRIQIELNSENWHKENELLRIELEEWKLKCDQLEAWAKENISPIDVKELVSGYVRVAQRLSDQGSYNALHKRDLINFKKLKEFCNYNKISIFQRTSGFPKVNKSVECLLWTTNPELVSKPDTCTRATQCAPAPTQEQGTQYKTFTLSCGTMTTSVPPVERTDAATNFPEPKQLSPFHEILNNTIKVWDINPISPIIDPPESTTKEINTINPITDSPKSPAKQIQPLSPITDPPEALPIKINSISPINAPPEPHTKELVKEMQTVGTCTILCNVLTNLDDVLQLPKIKSCDSRPPSRSMFSSVKDEMCNLNLPYGGLKDYFNEKLLSSKSFGEESSISNFTPDMFEELWQLFGQMVLGLLQRRSTHPNSRKEEFNSWLPKMYEACQNFEHEILLQTLPIGVSSSKDSMDGHHTNQKDYINQHTDPLPKTKSIGTSPIKSYEFENFDIVGEKDNNSNNKKTSDKMDIRRIRLSLERSMFRPIDSQENPNIIKLSNASNTNTSNDKSFNETAVNFLSTLSTFQNVCGDSLEDLDESEMELLASANCSLYSIPPHSQNDLESTLLELNEYTGSTARGGEIEMDVDKSLESINVNTEPDTSKVDNSLESINVNLLTELSPEKVVENDSYEEDDIFSNLIIDETIIPSDISNDKLNMDCSVKRKKLEQHQTETKNDSASQLCRSDLSAINALFDDTTKPPQNRTRKRKQKTYASQNFINPCKRSARLAEKRLLEENKNMFDNPMIIGKYTTTKHKEEEPETNIQDSVKNENCDKPTPFSTSIITCSTISDRTYAPNVGDFVTQRSAISPFTSSSHTKVTPTTPATITTTPATTTLSKTPSIMGYGQNINNLSDAQLNDNNKHKGPSISVPAVDDFESPSSPQPSQDCEEQFKSDSLPIQIPLNLRKSIVMVGSNSLIENLMKKERHNMAKANKNVESHEGKLIRAMHTKITEYLQSSKEYDFSNLCNDLQKISQKEDLYISALLDSATLKLFGNNQEPQNQSINTRFMNALQYLQEMYPEFLTLFLSKLDLKLFTFNQSMKPTTLSESLNLLKIYLMTIQLQAATSASSEFKNPARIIIAKILYFFQKDVPRLVYEVLCQFPTVLPYRYDKTYDHSDPLITVIKYELMNYKYEMYDEELCGRHLLSKLRYEYHFEIYKPLQQDVLNQLITKLESGQLKHLQLSFAVFCKRMNTQKCIKDVINGRLLPLANTYYDLAKLSTEYDERIAALFNCMSTVLKSFILQKDIDAYMSVFKRFLYSIKRPCVQEAAVQAIIRLQRYGFNLCSESLKDFHPNYTLQPLTVAMLRSFAQRRTQNKRPH